MKNYTFKISSLSFDVDREEIPLELLMKLIKSSVFKRFEVQVSCLSHPQFVA